MGSEIPKLEKVSWKELEEKVGKIEPGQILELNLLRKGLLIPRLGILVEYLRPECLSL